MVSVSGIVGATTTTSTGTSSTNLLQLSGLASGMDTQSMVNSLMQAARIPRDQVYQQQQWAEWQQADYRNINLAVQTFRTSEENLRLQSNFIAYGATPVDPTIATVTPTANAVQGNYTVTVNNTAQVASFLSGRPVLNSGGVAAKSTDTILASGQTASITVSNSSGSHVINIDSTMTYGGLAAAIAGSTDDTSKTSLGLNASFDDATHTFLISSNSTGLKQGFTITNTSGNITDVMNGNTAFSTTTSANSISQSGKDASVTISLNGSTTTATSSTNTVSALGLSINTLKAGATDVSVATNTDAVYKSITDFIDAYNTLIDTVNTKVNEQRDRNYPPLTDQQRSQMTESQISTWESKAKVGTLSQDSTLEDILDSFRSAINTPVKSIPTGNINTLSQIGVGTEFLKSDGTLVMDTDNTGKIQYDPTTLKNAIANNPNGVMQLFTASDPQAQPLANPPVAARTDYEGIGARLYDVANNAINELTARAGVPNMATNDDSALGQQIKDYADQLNTWDDRLSTLQAQYNSEFTQMETAINQLNSQGGFLSQLSAGSGSGSGG